MKIDEIVDDSIENFIMTSKTKKIPFHVSMSNRTWKIYKITGASMQYLGSQKDTRGAKEWLRRLEKESLRGDTRYVASKIYLDGMNINKIIKS